MRMRRIGLVLIAKLIAVVTTSAVAETAPLRIGFYLPAIREANQADLKVSLNLWAEAVGKPFGVRIVSSTFDSMSGMRQALERGEVNFINAPGMELAEYFAPNELREGYARRTDGQEEGVALVVARDGGIETFADLKGRRVMRLANDRLSELFFETRCLKEAKRSCSELFNIIEEKRDSQSLHAVFFGRADAALVNLSTLRTATELNPQVAQRVRVLMDWKAKGVFFGMMTRHTDPAYRSLIINSAREAVKTPRGQQLLQLFRTDHLDPVDTGALKPYWALLAEYRESRKILGAGR